MRLDLMKAKEGCQRLGVDSAYEHSNVPGTADRTSLAKLKESVTFYEFASDFEQLIQVLLKIIHLDTSEYYIELFLRTIRGLENELIYLRSFIQFKESDGSTASFS